MQRRGWRRHRAILLREHRLIILRIARVGWPLARDIGRQGHGPGALQQDFDRLIPFEKQSEAAVAMAFFGYGHDAFAKINHIAGMQAFGIADKRLPTAQVDPFVQGRADGGIAAPPLKLRRNDPCVIEDQAITLAQHRRQVAHRAVRQCSGPAHA